MAEEFLFYMEEKQTRFLESSDSHMKKLVPNAVPESTRKSTNHTGLKISYLPSKLRFSAKYLFFGQSLSRGHDQPTYQLQPCQQSLSLLDEKERTLQNSC